MTDAEMLSRIYQGLKQIEASGCDFGRIELVVRDGQVKHVNVCFEVKEEEKEMKSPFGR